MPRPTVPAAAIAFLCVVLLLPTKSRASDDPQAKIATVVEQAIRPLMQRHDIPGMAVGIVMHGESHVYNYGVASKATGAPVTDTTLFELGSVSKTFTATLASYAQVTGKLSLSDTTSRDFPALRGSSFDHVTLLNLATHTSGGLPLQVPGGISNPAQLVAYLQSWKPAYAPGAARTYSNIGIGMLGVIAARSMHGDFAALMAATLFAGLGMPHTYLNVPSAVAANYAQGYTRTDQPIRMAPGVLAAEAYGIRTTAGDMLRFVAANIGTLAIDTALQRAITATHTGYFQVGAMTQDLIWEQYHEPVALPDLLDGNGAGMQLRANPVVRLQPPLPPRDDVLINKSGTTNGFGAYVAFLPAKRLGIVLLGNKNYPIDARVTTAFEIMARLEAAGMND